MIRIGDVAPACSTNFKGWLLPPEGRENSEKRMQTDHPCVIPLQAEVHQTGCSLSPACPARSKHSSGAPNRDRLPVNSFPCIAQQPQGSKLAAPPAHLRQTESMSQQRRSRRLREVRIVTSWSCLNHAACTQTAASRSMHSRTRGKLPGKDPLCPFPPS